MSVSCLTFNGCLTNIVKGSINECEIHFLKEGIKGLAFKGISHITDLSEASVPLTVRLSSTRPNQKVEGEGPGCGGAGRRG